jgi:hypothetical protein
MPHAVAATKRTKKTRSLERNTIRLSAEAKLKLLPAVLAPSSDRSRLEPPISVEDKIEGLEDVDDDDDDDDDGEKE